MATTFMLSVWTTLRLSSIKLIIDCLLDKLKRYGFPDKLIKWIQSFLTDRTQQVVVNGHLPALAIIISSVQWVAILIGHFWKFLTVM